MEILCWVKDHDGVPGLAEILVDRMLQWQGHELLYVISRQDIIGWGGFGFGTLSCHLGVVQKTYYWGRFD